MTNEAIKIPKWYWVVAILLLIWNLMGLGSFIFHTTISEEALQAYPQIEREHFGAYPLWTKFVFALAVFSGLGASILLLLKKQNAKTVFIISLIAIIIQMGHSIFIAGAMDVYGTEALFMPIILIFIGIFSIWFANHAIDKNWIY